MTNTYTWKINHLECQPVADSLSNVVVAVNWDYTGLSDQTRKASNDFGHEWEETFSASYNGVTQISLNPDEPFTPFKKLSEDQVISWVKQAIGDENLALMTQAIDAEIARKISPPTVNLSVPWQNK